MLSLAAVVACAHTTSNSREEGLDPRQVDSIPVEYQPVILPLRSEFDRLRTVRHRRKLVELACRRAGVIEFKMAALVLRAERQGEQLRSSVRGLAQVVSDLVRDCATTRSVIPVLVEELDESLDSVIYSLWGEEDAEQARAD